MPKPIKCNCPACSPEQCHPLPRHLWKSGQRVMGWYHSSGNPPVRWYGTIAPYQSPGATCGVDGIYILPDNPRSRDMWLWPYAVEGGTGYQSPIMEA